MYRGSPIFDVPEYPSMMRVKPLPKRRRTDVAPQSENEINVAPAPSIQNVTTESLIAHADSLAAQLALQSYYLPILGDCTEFARDDDGENRSPQPIDFGSGYGTRGYTWPGGGSGRWGLHRPLQLNPGNTKKEESAHKCRRSHHHGHDAGVKVNLVRDEPTERSGSGEGRADLDDPVDVFPSTPPSRDSGAEKGKVDLCCTCRTTAQRNAEAWETTACSCPWSHISWRYLCSRSGPLHISLFIRQRGSING